MDEGTVSYTDGSECSILCNWSSNTKSSRRQTEKGNVINGKMIRRRWSVPPPRKKDGWCNLCCNVGVVDREWIVV